MSNIYYSPEDCGLEVVGRLDQPDLDYEFHVLCVWKHTKSGVIFWGEDAGCSCPIEFEDDHFNGPQDTSLDKCIIGLFKAIKEFPCPEAEKDMLFKWIKKAILG